MQYSWIAKNEGKDLIYETRLRLIRKMKLNPFGTRKQKLYSYFMEAELGIILIDFTN